MKKKEKLKEARSIDRTEEAKVVRTDARLSPANGTVWKEIPGHTGRGMGVLDWYSDCVHRSRRAGQAAYAQRQP